MMQPMEKNKNFDNWYKNRITENLTEPPADAWENISDELDTLEVWDRISAQLDTPGGWSAHKTLYYAVPVAVLLLLSAGMYYYYNTTTDPAPVTTTAFTVEDEITATPEVTKENPVRDNKPEKASPNDQATGQPPQQVLRNDNGKAIASADVDARSGQRKKETTTSKETDTPDETQVKKALASDETHKGDNDPLDQDLIATEDREIKRDSGETPNGTHDDTRAVKTTDVQKAKTDHLQPQAEIYHATTEKVKESEEVIDQENVPVNKTAHGTPSHNIAISGNNGTVVSLIVPDSMLAIYPVEAAILPVSLEDVEANPDDEKPSYQKSIEFGVTASAKNTWLLNRTTLMGLEKHTLTTTLPDFGKDIGMVVTYHFSPRWSAQAEGMFLSELGQRYQEYRNGKYVGREVDLRYYTMNLVMKYNRNAFIGAAPANGHALVGGIFAGRLHRATETISDNTTDNADDYTQFNYGVLAGYEYNRYIFKNLVFTTGLRVNYGFPNIDALRYSRTVTGSFDVNVALKYRLGL